MHTDVLDRPQVTVSDAAIRRIAAILAADKVCDALRISVTGGGCSGFSYQYDLVKDDRADDDLVIERDGAIVLIDAVSIQYMAGSQVDFVDDLMGQSFQIRNPNAVASCGCGTSFAV
ncbi:MAG: heme biosynthesis protein HemY [Alphaproteobacteria bacterium]|nr:MAG: heme biosynthesis protein HemY [Alphaproteobacteria bacterium]